MNQGSVNFEGQAANADTAGMPVQSVAQAASELAGAAPVPAEQTAAQVHTMNLTLLVTLGLGDDRMFDLKALKSVPVEVKGVSQLYNLYNPFMRPKSGDGEGVLRATLRSILRVADKLAGSNVVYLGDNGAAFDTANAIAANIATRTAQLLPIAQNEELLEITQIVDDVPQPPAVLTFGDVLRVKAWAVQGHGDLPGVVTNNIYVNLMCNVGAAYDSEEPHNFVAKVASLLTNTVNKMSEEDALNGSMDVFLGVGVDSTTLVNDRMQELLGLLTTEHGFGVVSLAHVLAGKEDWIDQDQAACLFDRNCDIVLMRNLFAEDEPEDDEVEDDPVEVVEDDEVDVDLEDEEEEDEEEED